MKNRPVFVVAFALLLLAPIATAVPDGTSGLNVLVKTTGTDQDVQFRFPITDDDPGSYTYNITIDSGVPVDFSDVETTFGGIREDGFITFELTFSGATDVYDAWVYAWDGSSAGAISCTVNFDTAIQFDYDSCGEMDPTYSQAYCMNTDSADNFGFSAVSGVGVAVGSPPSLEFSSTADHAAYGGLNLGGDTTEYLYNFQFRSVVDGATSKVLFFFSENDLEASASSVGDGSVAVASSFTVPRTASFSNGIGVAFEESGSNYDVKIFQNQEGTTTVLFEDEWSDGIGANTLTAGTLKFSSYAGIYEITFGNELARFSTADLSDIDPFHTFWITEYGGKSGLFFAAHSLHQTDDIQNCLSSIDGDLGGAVAATGARNVNDPLENFDGQGGALSRPTFPYVNMPTIAERMDISEEAAGYIFAGLSVLILLIVGFAVGAKSGAVVGLLLILPFTTQLGQIPRWLVVLVFIGVISYATFKKSKTQAMVI